jgi:hypothetical protein
MAPIPKKEKMDVLTIVFVGFIVWFIGSKSGWVQSVEGATLLALSYLAFMGIFMATIAFFD